MQTLDQSKSKFPEEIFMSFAEFEKIRDELLPPASEGNKFPVQFTVTRVPHRVDDEGKVIESALEVTLRNDEGRPLPIKTFLFHESEEDKMHKFLRRRFSDYCQGQ